MRGLVGWVGASQSGGSNERNVLMRVDFSGSGRNLEPGKTPGIHKGDPS